LSPADDVLIGVERALDLDSEGQLIASVLSKKVAAGSTHVVIDMPVGPTAKVRSTLAANRLGLMMRDVGAAVGLHVRVVTSDGSEPVGRGVGPALEAREVCAVLRGEADASRELRERSLRLSAEILELAGGLTSEDALTKSRAVLEDGRAWRKFVAICEAQGGIRELRRAAQTRDVVAGRDGVVSSIDNRRLARVAKLAGAPTAKASGLMLHARVGVQVERGQPLYTIHADARGELDYAFDYASSQQDIIKLEASS
jgi:thymidine phosphorylase